MKTSDFSFELPETLVAQEPPAERGRSRLMLLDRTAGTWHHSTVAELPELLGQGLLGGRPLLVFNDSRVRKARVYGVPVETGTGTPQAAPVEFLLLERLDPHTWKAMCRRAKRRKPGSRYTLPAGVTGTITAIETEGGFRILRFDTPIDDAWLDTHGHIPLPPYIRREDRPADAERYQTVYAKDGTAGFGPGRSAAAPTAGLHFTEELLKQLDEAGVEQAFVTLHVGLGTFLPVHAGNIEDHHMHTEYYRIDAEAAGKINRAKAEGRRVVAVGTTSLRTLESASSRSGDGTIAAGEGSTSIFIYPGYRFRAVDALFTNFHTPESTLLMLVAAFAGRELILSSYAEAVRRDYRFFSYGDAMLIH